MGIGNGIDRLLRTLRTPAEARGPAVSDPVTGLPFPAGAGNGSSGAGDEMNAVTPPEDTAAVAPPEDAPPPGQAFEGPAESAGPPPRPVETLNAWVDAAYRAHQQAVREVAPAEEPAPGEAQQQQQQPEPTRASMRESPIVELFRPTTETGSNGPETPADGPISAADESAPGARTVPDDGGGGLPEWSPAEVPEWAPVAAEDVTAASTPSAALHHEAESDDAGEQGDPSDAPEHAELVHDAATDVSGAVERADAGGTPVVPSGEADAAPPLPAGLHADALARLEAASGVAESLGLGFHLGAAVERIASGASRGRDGVDALREAAWLIERYVALVEQRPLGADLHASSVRLGRSGDAIVELRALTAELELRRAVREALMEGGAPRADAPASEESPEKRPEPTPDPVSSSVTNEQEAEQAPVQEATQEPDPTPSSTPAAEREPFGREVALMAIRWAIMVVAVVAVVLAVTLIGEWL
jgi:hypothetical protein